MILIMHAQMISEWFAYVKPMYWPVLCLEIVRFYLFVWADADEHGVCRRMIVAVNDHGRIWIKYIEDAPPEDWRVRLPSVSAYISRLMVSAPRGLTEGAISNVARMIDEGRQRWTLGSSPRAAYVEASYVILEPG